MEHCKTAGVVHRKSDLSVFEQLDYAYDPAGQRTGLQTALGDRVTWVYDTAGQLHAEARSGTVAYRSTFMYDAAGNRIRLDKDGDVTDYDVTAANQIACERSLSGRTTYSYDATGNQTLIETPAGDLTTTTWDYEQQQRSVELPDDTIVTFAYDADRKRRTRSDALETRAWYWDQNNLLVETNNLGLVEARYLYEPEEFGNLVSQHRDGETNWYHFDALGTAVALTDSVQVVTDWSVYDAWGKELAHSGTTPNPSGARIQSGPACKKPTRW